MTHSNSSLGPIHTDPPPTDPPNQGDNDTSKTPLDRSAPDEKA